MPDSIDVHGLSPEQVETLEKLVVLFREAGGRSEQSGRGLEASAGAWKGLVDAEALKRDIYEDRLIRTRRRAGL